MTKYELMCNSYSNIFSAMSPTKASDIVSVGNDCQKKHMATDDWCTCFETCTLPKHIQEVALIQLRENESARKQAISAFRQWISKNADIQNVITGMVNNYILKYHNIRLKTLNN
jgi:hypothetical protein